MVKRRSTPYPRHRRTKQLTKVQDKDEADENTSENMIKYRQQSNIVKPVPKRGREAFAEILNKEWELREGEVFPANIQSHTVEEDSQTKDDGIDSLWGSPSPDPLSPPPLALPVPNREVQGDNEGAQQPRGLARLFGLSAEDAVLVARYLDWTPVDGASPTTAGTEYDRLSGALEGHVVMPNLDTLLVEPQHNEANTTGPDFMEPIIPLDIDLVFRYDGTVLHIEVPGV